MNDVLVSIITVTYNAQDFLEQTMSSVFSQTYSPIEYIIIDGGSTDKTLDIIRKNEEKISFWTSEKDNGIYDAMNKGILCSKGELIGIINASDYYENDAIESVVLMYKQHPECGIFHGNVNMLNTDGSFFKLKKPTINLSNLYRGMDLYHPTFFVAKSAYEKHGLYDIQFKIAADFDFALRYYNAGVNYFYIDKVISSFRKGGVSSKEKNKAMLESKNVLIKNGYSNKIAKDIFKRWTNLNRKNRVFDTSYQLLKKVLPEILINRLAALISVKQQQK